MANHAAGEENVTAGGKPALAPQENPRPIKQRKVRGVTVPVDTIRPLNEHYVRLVGFINGFMLFGDLHDELDKIRATLENHSRWADKWQLLYEIRAGLESIDAKLPSPVGWAGDPTQLENLRAAVSKANHLMSADDGLLAGDPEETDTVRQMSGPLTRLVTGAESIANQCRTSCDAELSELGRHVKNILDQLERRSAGGTTGSNEPSELVQAPQEAESNPAAEFGRLVTGEKNVTERSVRREAANGQ